MNPSDPAHPFIPLWLQAALRPLIRWEVLVWLVMVFLVGTGVGAHLAPDAALPDLRWLFPLLLTP